jgi:hypothetical protein
MAKDKVKPVVVVEETVTKASTFTGDTELPVSALGWHMPGMGPDLTPEQEALKTAFEALSTQDQAIIKRDAMREGVIRGRDVMMAAKMMKKSDASEEKGEDVAMDTPQEEDFEDLRNPLTRNPLA